MNDHPTYEAVLVPTDGSDTAAAAIDHALGIADRYGAALHAVYVVDTTGYGGDGDTVVLQDALEEHGRRALERVETAGDEAGIDTVETELLLGSPHRAILDYADDHDVDLIVMGTHGRRGIDRYLLGSVTEKVVRLAEVPVLAVHGADDDREGDADEPAGGDR